MKKLQTRQDQKENALPCKHHTVAKHSRASFALRRSLNAPSKQKPITRQRGLCLDGLLLKITPTRTTIPAVRFIYIPLRNRRSHWHDSAPQGERDPPIPPGLIRRWVPGLQAGRRTIPSGRGRGPPIIFFGSATGLQHSDPPAKFPVDYSSNSA